MSYAETTKTKKVALDNAKALDDLKKAAEKVSVIVKKRKAKK